MRAGSGELTPREKEVVLLIASGLSSRQIAQELAISLQTVIVHRCNAMRKLKVNNAIGLVRAAIRMGLVDR